jgi:hypothetical protein
MLNLSEVDDEKSPQSKHFIFYRDWDSHLSLIPIIKIYEYISNVDDNIVKDKDATLDKINTVEIGQSVVFNYPERGMFLYTRVK